MLLNSDTVDKSPVIVSFQFLENKMAELDTLSGKLLDELIKVDATTETAMRDAIDNADEYKIDFLEVKLKVESLIQRPTISDANNQVPKFHGTSRD